jgi:hypothetical protein
VSVTWDWLVFEARTLSDKWGFSVYSMIRPFSPGAHESRRLDASSRLARLVRKLSSHTITHKV